MIMTTDMTKSMEKEYSGKGSTNSPESGLQPTTYQTINLSNYQTISGLKYVIEQLDILSVPGRKLLMASPYLYTEEDIRQELEQVEHLVGVLTEGSPENLDLFRHKLSQLKNIEGSIHRLEALATLDDIELFEVKALALLTEEIAVLSEQLGISIIRLPDLSAIVDILDPEQTRLPHFYIYDAYSPELAQLRKQLRQITGDTTEEQIRAGRLYEENALLEDEIRLRLSGELHGYASQLAEALHKLARLDLLRAKALLAIQMPLCRPVIGAASSLQGVYHPQIREALVTQGKAFQPVDISIPHTTTLISGANMAGKTVLLKTVALTQALFQFGFFVPAREATLCPVEQIMTSIGDQQSELHGLSSFAAEMLALDRIIREVRKGTKILALVDEPARTTNPEEGKALVNALVELLSAHQVSTLITTHYSGIEAPARRVRVKGFTGREASIPVTLQNINDFMDYSLLETDGQEAPHEALQIAAILRIDEELLEKTKKYL